MIAALLKVFQKARVSVKQSVYQGQLGFLIYGRDCYDRSVRVFVLTRNAAEAARANIKAGKDALDGVHCS